MSKNELSTAVDTEELVDGRLQRFVKKAGWIAYKTAVATSIVSIPFSTYGHAESDARADLEVPKATVSYTPENTCSMPPTGDFDYDQSQLVQAAYNCIAIRKAPIAVVAFGGMSIDRLTEITHEASRAIDTGFDGTVAPRLVPILASPAAEAAFDAANEECVDAADVERYASRIADETMQLTDYINVVGLTDLAACPEGKEPGPKGISNGSFGRKYMDIYDVSIIEPEAYIPEPTSQAGVIAHEIGHGFEPLQLSHAGSVVTKTARESIRLQSGYSTESVPEVVDISQLVQDNKFEEYGEIMNVMGSHTMNATSAKLNTMQLRKILWPERVLNGERDPMVMINGTNARIERSDEQLHTFAAMQLDIPIDAVTIDKNGKEDRETFDQLIFDPLITSEHGPGGINVQIFLFNSQKGQSLFINGVSGSKNSPQDITLTMQKQSVNISIAQDDSFFITDTSK